MLWAPGEGREIKYSMKMSKRAIPRPCEMITLKINISKALQIFPLICVWLPFFFSQEPIWSKIFLLCSEISLIKHWRTNNGPQKNNQATMKEIEIFWSQEVGKSMHIREVFQKKGLFFMTFTIKCRTPPPPFNGTFFHPFLPHFLAALVAPYPHMGRTDWLSH